MFEADTIGETAAKVALYLGAWAIIALFIFNVLKVPSPECIGWWWC